MREAAAKVIFLCIMQPMGRVAEKESGRGNVARKAIQLRLKSVNRGHYTQHYVFLKN